jgi:hypothetical protein
MSTIFVGAIDFTREKWVVRNAVFGMGGPEAMLDTLRRNPTKKS